MVDLQRGVQSYLIAKSSSEQDGYEPAPDTCRCPPSVPGPGWRPGRVSAATNKIVKSKKSSRGPPKKFSASAVAPSDRPGANRIASAGRNIHFSFFLAAP